MEYVVVHELIHLLERRHNARFMAHMDDFLPNWQIIK
ncbi:TPA: YgjP-like metallopeptidase domain-containing protein [Neisseria lactamica]|nr:YgjP-like metallopeptidase domain-containing protein [Neisseria lactamica]